MPAHTQYRFQPVGEHPDVAALGLVLRQLGTVGTLMMTTAHPDDENNALLARYRFQHGMRTTLVTATRGNGGQNEIGPEIFESLAVLRTEELLAAHRIDGAEQYFARAVDFGFSFSVDETYERWHREKILEDYVYWIRKIRPDVIVGFVWDHTQGGGQHHQASSHISAEAFRAAADATKFPEQIAAGLKPWQASKFYYTGGFGPSVAVGRRQTPSAASTATSSIRCSDARTTNSGARRAACTCARACPSSTRCRVPSRARTCSRTRS